MHAESMKTFNRSLSSRQMYFHLNSLSVPPFWSVFSTLPFQYLCCLFCLAASLLFVIPSQWCWISGSSLPLFSIEQLSSRYASVCLGTPNWKVSSWFQHVTRLEQLSTWTASVLDVISVCSVCFLCLSLEQCDYKTFCFPLWVAGR